MALRPAISPDSRDHLILALDVPTAAEAIAVAERLKDHVGYFKIGLQLFTSSGPAIVQDIRKLGCKVFLDLKLHDIPNTVANAVTEAAGLGVDLLTLHTMGGPEMLRRAREVIDELPAGASRPRLLGVTVLTSMDQDQIDEVGFGFPVNDLVLRLALLAEKSRMDGLVCSPLELDRLRTAGVNGLFYVTPGIRPAGAQKDDQARITTAGQAISKGARFLVVGRPILKAPDPVKAAESILSEIEAQISSL